MPIPFDPPQAGFDRQQGARHPAVLLLRRAPAVHLVRQLAQLRVQRFQTVGGLEAVAQGAEDSEQMQRQGFFQAFLQAGCGRAVDEPQLTPEFQQSGTRRRDAGR